MLNFETEFSKTDLSLRQSFLQEFKTDYYSNTRVYQIIGSRKTIIFFLLLETFLMPFSDSVQFLYTHTSLNPPSMFFILSTVIHHILLETIPT